MKKIASPQLIVPVYAGWVYQVEHVARDGSVKSVETVKNLMPTNARNYVLNASFKGGTQYATLYLGLYDNNRTPVAGDTMVEVAAEYGENVDYTGSERATISLPAVANGATNTLSSPNEFNFTTSESIRGAFISSSPTWSGSTGVLISAVLFSSPKTVGNGETLRVPVGFALLSA